MMRTVVDQVAALTKAAQVSEPIISRIMIEVRGGKHDMRCPDPSDLLQIRPTSGAPPSVAPRISCLIVPSPVRNAAHGGAMRPAATLAYASGPFEAHTPAELTPMSGIQAAKLWPDRHGRPGLAH
jgi:hypothetical protein